MSSSIDRAFIRAFAKQRSGEMAAPAHRETVEVSGNAAAELDAAPVSAAPSAAATEKPTEIRRVDPPQAAGGPLYQQAVVGAAEMASVNVTTFEVSQLAAQAPASTEPPAPVEPPRDVTRALTPEQVMRRLDEPSSIAAPHASGDDNADDIAVEETEDAEAIAPVELPGEGEDAETETETDDSHETNAIEPAEESAAAEEEARRIAMQGPFVPAWETDSIQWPRLAERLTSLDNRFRDAGRQLAAATSDGLRVLTVTSTYRGEGRTMVAMNLARSASEAGVRVALVDGDVDNPALASAAGIAAAHGWHECLDGGLPLDEAAVASVQDGVTLLPLTSAVRRSSVAADGPAFASMLDSLSMHFDLVIVDHGPLGAGAEQLETLAGDAAILVRDIRCTSAEQALATVRRIRDLGTKSVGVVQNFT